MRFVTGCARSGTSLTTGILRACGARLGPVNPLNENTKVRDRIIKPYLESLGCDPLGQHPLAEPNNLKPYPEFREHVLNALSGADTYKCAKAGPIWPLFDEHFPDATWVIVRRRQEDIVASCKRTHFMKKSPNWNEWVNYHLQRFDEMKLAMKDRVFEVWPHEGIKNPDYFRPLIEWCGLEWRPDAVRDVINPNQWHAA